jgi:protein-tyrosine phosphatase
MSADIYWIKDTPGGRLAILGRPRAGDWLADEIADWKAAGVTDVVSLLEQHEVRETGLMQEAELTAQAGISFESFAIPDRGVPASLQATHMLWTSLAEKVRGGRAVGIHCRASIGRAGLIATGILVRMGLPVDEAWLRTSAARGRAVPDTEEQRMWLAAAFHRTERESNL